MVTITLPQAPPIKGGELALQGVICQRGKCGHGVEVSSPWVFRFGGWESGGREGVPTGLGVWSSEVQSRSRNGDSGEGAWCSNGGFTLPQAPPIKGGESAGREAVYTGLGMVSGEAATGLLNQDRGDAD